jgi:hypothetical protein
VHGLEANALNLLELRHVDIDLQKR